MPAAPSVRGDELPAVSVPLPLVRSNTGGSRASFSSDVSRRGMPSRTTESTGMMSSKKPRSWQRSRGDDSRAQARPAPCGRWPRLRHLLAVLAHALSGGAFRDTRYVESDLGNRQRAHVLKALLPVVRAPDL